MTNFNVGDTVELDRDSDLNEDVKRWYILHFDVQYIIQRIDGGFLYISDVKGGWHSNRFKLVSQKPNMKSATEKKFTHERFNQLVKDTFDKINELSNLKGGEYAGDSDRLENFRRNGKRLDLPMEAIWHTYIAKHWDAVEQYIKDLLKDKSRERMEPLGSRLDDMILYCLLFKAMLLEKEEK